MNKGCKISVIIPVYNAEKLVEKCIKSIISQSYNNLEIIVVDDGSTDTTKEIIESIAMNDKRVIYIHQKNSGVSAARNAGIERSSGELITFVDADDWLEIDALEKMYLAMEPQIGFVCCGTFIHNTNKIETYSVGKDTKLTKDETLDLLYSDSFVRPVVWGKLYKAEMIRGKLLFDVKIAHAEDIKFVSDFVLNTKRNVLLNYCGYHYFMDNENSAMHQLCNNKTSLFKEKWISSWSAYEQMEQSLKREKVHEDVYKKFIESKVECGKACLKILYQNYQDKHRLIRIIKRYILKNYLVYLRGDRESFKSKISTLICVIMPPSVNRMLRR